MNKFQISCENFWKLLKFHKKDKMFKLKPLATTLKLWLLINVKGPGAARSLLAGQPYAEKS